MKDYTKTQAAVVCPLCHQKVWNTIECKNCRRKFCRSHANSPFVRHSGWTCPFCEQSLNQFKQASEEKLFKYIKTAEILLEEGNENEADGIISILLKDIFTSPN